MQNLSKLKVAVVQAAPVAFDLDATLQRLHAWLEQAAEQGAQLVVFPEAYIGGYPKGSDFGARVGQRSEQGRVDFQRYFQSAIKLPGPESEQIGQWCRDLGLHAVIGVIEQHQSTLYCGAAFWDDQGQLLGCHRKLMPTAMERLIWGFGDGATLDVQKTRLGRVGAVICWENYMPMLRMSQYQQGVQIYCAPTVDDRDCWIPTMQHIAVEGRCFVLSSCQYSKRSDYPDDYVCIQGDDPEQVLIRGGSCIIDPFGEMLASPVYQQQSLLVAELDLDRIIQGKYDLDVAGHYERPDIFELKVDRKPRI